eukprot:414223-Ditylum_brightwellii.AAC.1
MVHELPSALGLTTVPLAHFAASPELSTSSIPCTPVHDTTSSTSSVSCPPVHDSTSSATSVSCPASLVSTVSHPPIQNSVSFVPSLSCPHVNASSVSTVSGIPVNDTTYSVSSSTILLSASAASGTP